MLRLLSAEGSGFDLSSFKIKAVILEANTGGGGEANALAGECFWRKPNVLLLCLPPPLQDLPFQNKLHLSFSNGCRVVCVMGG